MENQPKQPHNSQNKPPASHVLEDLLGLLADLHSATTEDECSSSTTNHQKSDSLDSADNYSNYDAFSADAVDRNSPPPSSKIIAAHRQALLRSISQPVPHSKSSSKSSPPSHPNSRPNSHVKSGEKPASPVVSTDSSRHNGRHSQNGQNGSNQNGFKAQSNGNNQNGSHSQNGQTPKAQTVSSSEATHVKVDFVASPEPPSIEVVTPEISLENQLIVDLVNNLEFSSEINPANSSNINLGSGQEINQKSETVVNPDVNLEVNLENSLGTNPEVSLANNLETNPEVNSENNLEATPDVDSDRNPEVSLENNLEATPSLDLKANPEVNPENNLESNSNVDSARNLDVNSEANSKDNLEANSIHDRVNNSPDNLTSDSTHQPVISEPKAPKITGKSSAESARPIPRYSAPNKMGATVDSLGFLIDLVLTSAPSPTDQPAEIVTDSVDISEDVREQPLGKIKTPDLDLVPDLPLNLPKNPAESVASEISERVSPDRTGASETLDTLKTAELSLSALSQLLADNPETLSIDPFSNSLDHHTPVTFTPEELEEDPLDILQRLLVNPDVYDAQKLLQSLEVSLKKLESQIYEPEKLIDLLLPTIANLLSMKISQSKEEVVDAITPIIDEVIQHRIQQDRVAMSGAIAPIISEAISRQITDSPEEIAAAIGPTMGKAIQEQIRLEKDSMVDALYPIIGSTISKYMGEAIANINKQVETNFSAKGLKRKVQAKIQGVSEAELIFREAMPFTVLAAFLIHKSSGLLIADAQHPDQQQLESDMIAGMLTAIRSFANDCMAEANSSTELNQIDYSDSKIILEVAGYCYLALVVKGEMTKDFVKKFRRSMATIVQIYNRPIMNFDGDQSTIPPEIKILLEDMISYVPPSEKTNSRYPFALGFMVLGVVSIMAIPWGIYQYQRSINQRIAQQSATALDQTPELSVYRLETQVVDQKIKLLGKVPSTELQRKAAAVVSEVLPTWSIDNQIIAVDVPVDPSFTAAEIQRATIVMNKIPGVFISSQYKEGVLEINGMVKDRESIGSITQVMRTIPGVKILSNQIQLGNINQNNISNRVYFEAGSATLPPDSLPQISEFRKLLSLNPSFRLRITGYTDATGDPSDNQRLALARANSVQQVLLEQGIEQRQLEIRGSTDTTPGATELWQSRFVEFELVAPNNQN